MTSHPDENTDAERADADRSKLDRAGAAIDDARAAAGRVAKDETIDSGGDLPTTEENVPSASESATDDTAETGQ